MNFRFASIALLVLAIAAPVHAASFFLSSSDTDPLAGMDMTLDNGQTGSYWIWVNPEAGGGSGGEAITGLALDVLSSDAAVSEATGVDVSQGFATNGFNRWAESGGTHFGVGSLDDHVINLNAVGLGAQGIGNPLFVGFDENVNGSYLHAQVDFMATAVGMTTLTVQEGSGQITTNTGEPPLDFAGGTITVMGPGGGSDPVAAGDPADGSTISMQSAFRDGGILADAIMVSDTNTGSDPALAITGFSFNSNDFDLFSAQEGSDPLKVDLLIDVAAARQLPPGSMVGAELVVATNGGDLTYQLTAT
ncbi:MAG: hypothetical protein ACR2NM_05175, partial [Bythopirellula sp.]